MLDEARAARRPGPDRGVSGAEATEQRAEHGGEAESQELQRQHEAAEGALRLLLASLPACRRLSERSRSVRWLCGEARRGVAGCSGWLARAMPCRQRQRGAAPRHPTCWQSRPLSAARSAVATPRPRNSTGCAPLFPIRSLSLSSAPCPACCAPSRAASCAAPCRRRRPWRAWPRARSTRACPRAPPPPRPSALTRPRPTTASSRPPTPTTSTRCAACGSRTRAACTARGPRTSAACRPASAARMPSARPRRSCRCPSMRRPSTRRRTRAARPSTTTSR